MTARPIRVAIVDDHPVLREGTAALLAAQPGLEIAGLAGSIDEAEALVSSTDIDVVLLDVRLGTDSGLRWLTPPDPARPRTGCTDGGPRWAAGRSWRGA